MKRYALKKCPFCGGTPEMMVMEDGFGSKGKSRWVMCPCSAGGPLSRKSVKQAAEDWNRRVKPRKAKKGKVKRER